MRRSAIWLSLAFCWMFCTQTSAVSAQQAGRKHDHHGDPLPKGAYLRFGTTRLRLNQGVEGVSFTPDSKQLITVGWDKSIRFWDVKTGKPGRRLDNPSDGIFSAMVSDNGTRLATAGSSVIQLWNLESNELVFESHPSGRNYGIAFSPDGLTFATTGDDKTIHLWDMQTGDELLKLFLDDECHDSRPVAFSPSGALLAGGSDKSIRVWNLSEGGQVTTIALPKNSDLVSMAFADESSLISSGSVLTRGADGQYRMQSKVQLWQIPGGQLRHEYEIEGEELGGEACMAMSKDRSLIATLYHKRIIVWDVQTRLPKHELSLPNDSYFGGRTNGIAISPNQRYVATKSENHKAYLWDLTTGQELFPQADLHYGSVLSVDASSDGRWIVSSCTEGATYLWDSTTGRSKRKLHQKSGWTRDVVLFPDDQHIAVCGEFHVRDGDEPRFKGSLVILRVADGTTLQEWVLPDRGRLVAVSRSGKRVAVSIARMADPFTGVGGQRQIIVFDLPSGKRLVSFSDVQGEVRELRFSDDDDALWSLTDAHATKWSVKAAKAVDRMVLAFDMRRVQGIAFDGVGKRAFCVGTTGNGLPDQTSGNVVCRQVNEAKTVWRKELKQYAPNTVELSDDGRLLAVSLRPEWKSEVTPKLVLLDARTGKELQAFGFLDGAVRSLRFSPDRTTLYTGMNRGDILAWDITAANAEL